MPPTSRPAREKAANFTPSRIVIEGEGEFGVGDETRQVGPGDFIFIPRNTLHGRVRTSTPTMSTLSIYAPFFDRKKENIVWAEEE
ncbi:MAG: cupin domain-containing protein [Acidiferrobacterales bacterium]